MDKSTYIEKIIKTRGKDYYNKNKSLLDAEFEYIESLGSIDDIKKESSGDDLIISDGTKNI